MCRQKRMRFASICVALVLVAALAGFSELDRFTDSSEFGSIPIYADGMLIDTGILVGDTTYVCLRSFLKSVDRGLPYDWDEETQTASIQSGEISITAVAGEDYFTANDRAFFLPKGVISCDGEIMLPIREVCKIFGLTVDWIQEEQAVSVDVVNVRLLSQADDIYDEEDLYWLSRIIQAESGNQPFDGMIGVGNVVLNRVNDPSCPDNIYDVIFDMEHGVQFSPVENGSIYLEPSEDAIAAAKSCLEGYVTVENSLFFLNPEVAETSWFSSNRLYVVTIGDHDFYA